MHIQFLIEDISGKIFIEKVMDKYSIGKNNLTYDFRPFKGIGGFPKSGNIKRDKTEKLLNDLTIYLKGFEKSLSGIPAAIFVIVDNDDRNKSEFEKELKNISKTANVKIDHVYCIAVEEIEAWLLGDRSALLVAFPNAKTNVLDGYVQDSICGTWEVLANALYAGGLKKFRKDCPTFREIGKYKSLWAEKIGENITIHKNQSPSFKKFEKELNKRCNNVVESSK